MSDAFYTNSHQNQVRRLLPDLIRARQLLFDLIWKDLRARYRYAVMGFVWAVLEPLIMMVVLTFVFSFVFDLRFEKFGTDAGHGFGAVFILSGLIAWQFLATSLNTATRSFVDNQNLVTKVNFPREVIPLATIGVALVNFAIGGVLLLLLYVPLVGGLPGWGAVWIGPVFLIQLAMVIGMSLLFSSYNVSFRDVSYMVNAGLLFGFYATPIFYEPEMVEGALDDRNWGWLYPVYFANPMVGILTAYREALFANQRPEIASLVWPALCAAVVLVVGFVVFRKRSPTLADQI